MTYLGTPPLKTSEVKALDWKRADFGSRAMPGLNCVGGVFGRGVQ